MTSTEAIQRDMEAIYQSLPADAIGAFWRVNAALREDPQAVGIAATALADDHEAATTATVAGFNAAVTI